jgi:hypothetical protein
MMMTEVSLAELGPVDYVVVEFPAGASSFTGEMAAELRALVDSGTIRVIDGPSDSWCRSERYPVAAR